MKRQQPFRASTQSGFGVVVYLLLVVGLIAILTAGLAGDGGSQVSDAERHKIRVELHQQAEFIRDVIMDCPTTHGFVGGGSFPGYPSNQADGSDTGVVPVTDLVCPGSGGQPLFGTEFLMPRAIEGFASDAASGQALWQYIKNSDGVSIGIEATDPDIADQTVDLTANRFPTDDAAACNGGLMIFSARGSAGTGPHCNLYESSW